MKLEPVGWSWAEESDFPKLTLFKNSGTTVGHSDTKLGVNNKGWRISVAQMKNATSPYSRVIVKQDPLSTLGVMTLLDITTKKRYLFTVKGTSNNFLGNPSGLPHSALVAQAQTTALGKFYSSANSDVDGIAFAGEIGETLRLFTSPGKTLIQETKKFYQNFRRLGKKNPRGIVKGLNDLYLEWTYGVSPLMSDMKNTNSALHTLLDKVIVKHDHGFGASSNSSLETTIRSINTGHVHHNYSIRSSVEVTVNIGGGRKILTNSVPDYLARSFGFNLHNVPKSAYELLPYSFVVDYFSNLGDLISAVSGTYQTFFYTYTSTKVVKRYDIVYLGGSMAYAGIPSSYNYSSYGGESTETTFTRSLILPSGNFPDVQLQFKLPSMKQEFNLLSLATAYYLRRKP